MTYVPFLQREMKNKGYLWCTNITSLLLYNLIKQKNNLSNFFISFQNDWHLTATVTWDVNSIMFLLKSQTPTSYSMTHPSGKYSTMGEFFLYIYKWFVLYYVCPMLFLADKLLFCFVLAVCERLICVYECVDKCYLNNLSGSVTKLRGRVHLYKRFAHWREDVLFFIVFTFLLLCIICHHYFCTISVACL